MRLEDLGMIYIGEVYEIGEFRGLYFGKGELKEVSQMGGKRPNHGRKKNLDPLDLSRVLIE